MARLVIFDDTMRGIDLPDHAVMIGRSKKVDIPIRDGLLSRKHCSVVPMDEGFRLLDLKSQNGTFVNGEQVEKTDLEYDDVIEIGNTVLVLLDTDTWGRGEGLTKLRNPVKAQELIQRINKKLPLETIPDRAASNGAPKNGAAVDVEREIPLEVALLTDLVVHEYAKQVLQSAPKLKELISQGVRTLRSRLPSDAGVPELRREALTVVEESLRALARGTAARGTAARGTAAKAEAAKSTKKEETGGS